MPMLDERPVLRAGAWEERARTGGPLRDPEHDWDSPTLAAGSERAEAERCLGPTSAAIEVLSGGRANLNLRMGAEVLRIYKRDPGRAPVERALLAHPWRGFDVAPVVGGGDGFLVLTYLAHARVADSEAHGTAVGRALAEIHARSYAAPGLLGPDLEVAVPFTDPIGVLTDYVRQKVERWPAVLRTLGGGMLGFLDRHAGSLRRLATEAVRLHGDFKPANLRWSDRDRLLVFDWEFAYAGARLLDIGQLLRWGPSSAFLGAFARAYLEHGGRLVTRWRDWAAAFDLFNLAGLMTDALPGSRRALDLERRITQTLAQDP